MSESKGKRKAALPPSGPSAPQKKSRRAKRRASAAVVTPFPDDDADDVTQTKVEEVEPKQVEKKEDVKTEDVKTEEENGEGSGDDDIEDLDNLSDEDRIFLDKTANKEEDDDEPRGVVYIGRIPHGFYEDEMRKFFSQFGEITRLRISRNKKTGKSKHYGFIEFRHLEVAKVVAETMDGHLMFNHILRVKLMDEEKIHPKLFVGANKKFRVLPRKRLHAKRHNRKREPEEQKKLEKKLIKKDSSRKKKLAALGITYDYPGYAASVPPKAKE
jgi:nucleolar protein 15